ncbi:MAG: rod shape-determining protein MreC [Armatimonadota bacterium]
MTTGQRLMFVATLAVVGTALTIAHNRSLGAGRPSLIASAVIYVLSPGQKAVASVKRGVDSICAGLENTKRLQAENERLRRMQDWAQSLIIRNRELERENARLKALLGYRRQHSHATAARVVAENGSEWARTAIVDRGSRDGVRVKDIAITERGVVGQVWNVVSPDSAMVVLLTDSNSGIGAIVQRSRAVGILKGRGRGLPLLTYLPQDADVRPGDVLVTSGRGGVYPKGLPLGTVVRVLQGEDGVGKSAEVRPFADLNQLEEVLLVRGGEEFAQGPGS